MNVPTLSLICPTFGREALSALVPNVMPQLQPGDEFVIVGDGPVPYARKVAEEAGARYLEIPERVGDFGCTPCDYAIKEAMGDFVFFIGDDDQTVPNAFEMVRAGVQENPQLPHIFAMQHGGRLLKGSHECSMVSGQQIVLPWDLSKMPKMADAANFTCSDWHFIDLAVRNWGGVVYHDDVICVLERQNNGEYV